jgi:hypothetical protein
MKKYRIHIAVGLIVLVVIAVIVYRKRKAKAEGDTTHLTQGQWPDFSLPRGIRNNNPGNVRVSSSNWIGKVPLSENTDSTLVNGQPQLRQAFEQFVDMKHGVRCCIKILQNYRANHGLMTIRDLIHRYAPTNENHTDIYINFIADRTGLNPDVTFNPTKENMRKLVKAIIRFENGTNQEWVSDGVFNQAWAMIHPNDGGGTWGGGGGTW